MAIYQTVSTKVEAWKVARDFLPPWLSIACARGDVASVDLREPWWFVGMRVQTQEGEKIAQVGDWILHTLDGHLDVCPAAEFPLKYHLATETVE